MKDSANTHEGPWTQVMTSLVRCYTSPLRFLYEKRQNPVLAFHAYRIARTAKVDTPEWVLRHIDIWADVLCVDSPKGKDSICRELDLVSGGGGPSITSQAETQLRDLKVMSRIYEFRQFEKTSLDEAFDRTGKEIGLSYELTRNIWYRLTGAKPKN